MDKNISQIGFIIILILAAIILIAMILNAGSIEENQRLVVACNEKIDEANSLMKQAILMCPAIQNIFEINNTVFNYEN